MIKTETNKTYEVEEIVDDLEKRVTDLVTRDQIYSRIDDYLRDEPIKIGKNDYCYIKVVGNHLEIGRARIALEE